MKFIIATHNKKKLAEMERILNPIGIEVSTAQLQEVDETGTTFAGKCVFKGKRCMQRNRITGHCR
ncbi:MAG: non-canonical purine NTP pyrophosphatase [Acutalibacteraceae bacterium]